MKSKRLFLSKEKPLISKFNQGNKTMKNTQKYAVGSFHLGDIPICNICGKTNCTHLHPFSDEYLAKQAIKQKEEDEMFKDIYIELDLFLHPKEPIPVQYSKLIKVIK